jgi:hypothetical protein
LRTVQELTQRVRAEYLKMPELLLTADQVQRLCSIERTDDLPTDASATGQREVSLRHDRRTLRSPDGRTNDASGCQQGGPRDRRDFDKSFVTRRDATRRGVCGMLWMGMTAMVVGAIVAMAASVFGKRPIDVATLGSVSNRWIASHHMNAP